MSNAPRVFRHRRISLEPHSPKTNNTNPSPRWRKLPPKGHPNKVSKGHLDVQPLFPRSQPCLQPTSQDPCLIPSPAGPSQRSAVKASPRMGATVFGLEKPQDVRIQPCSPRNSGISVGFPWKTIPKSRHPPQVIPLHISRCALFSLLRRADCAYPKVGEACSKVAQLPQKLSTR